MAKRKSAVEDEAQSKRFLDLARELEAAGELNPTEDEGALDRLIRGVRIKPTEGETDLETPPNS